MFEEIKNQPEERLFQDHLTSVKKEIVIDGKTIAYMATVGTMVISEEMIAQTGEKADLYEGNKQRAEIFFIAYTKDDEQNAQKRPVTFSFNGGPGSSSVWVHMGFLGPRRVKLDNDGMLLPPPAEMVDNEYSILDKTDLVFIDPVGTGYSRALKGDKPKDFWGWRRDIESVGEFIRLYITRNKRWGSPKYIAGESYGTTRAIGLADYLGEKYGLTFNGLMLISTALDFSTLEFIPGNQLPFVLYLPTYAADAWYHNALSKKYQNMELEALLEEVRAYAAGPYAAALFKGDAISDAEKADVAKKLAAYTGLSQTYLIQTNLRIDIDRFCKELLRPRRQSIGRLDSRYIGYDRDAAGEKYEDDPSSYEIHSAYATAINDYISRELGFATDIPYIVSSDLWEHWDYKEVKNQFLYLQETIRKSMVHNKFMKIWVLNGYYDLATPFFASEYVFNQLQLEPAFRKNIRFTYYKSGHMIYLHIPSLKQFRAETDEFYPSN